MRASPHKPLAWNPKEIAFLEANAALGPGEDTQTFTTVKTRWVYNTLREVFIAPAGYVVKRFTHFPGRKDYRPVWRREHLALQQLSGLSVPRTKGYLKVAHPGGESSVLYLRELVPGTPLIGVDDNHAAAMAYLLQAFHARGVVTLDPQTENFIVVDRDDAAPVSRPGNSLAYEPRSVQEGRRGGEGSAGAPVVVPNRAAATPDRRTAPPKRSGAPEGRAAKGFGPALPAFDMEPPCLQAGALSKAFSGTRRSTNYPDGTLAFIDFGRARCFSPRNPLLYANIGKELLKLKREGGLSPGRYAMFLDAYRGAATYSRFNWAIIDNSFNFWQHRYARKDGVSV